MRRRCGEGSIGISLLLCLTAQLLLQRQNTQEAEFFPIHSCFGADLYAMPTAYLKEKIIKHILEHILYINTGTLQQLTVT